METADNIPTTIARRLREYRLNVALTQAELAVLLGVSVRTIQGWEAGQGTLPRAKHRRALAALLDQGEAA